MPNDLKRLFAVPLIKSNSVDGFNELFIHYFPASADGESNPKADMETFGPLFASREDLERLHDLLCQVLDLPRPKLSANSGDTKQ